MYRKDEKALYVWFWFGYSSASTTVIDDHKKDAIPTFIKNFNAIKATDNEISPETKFAIATSPFLQMLPEFFFKEIHEETFKNKVVWKLFNIFQGFDNLPFGYGRVRPINFDDEHFYFQHGDKDELKSI